MFLRANIHGSAEANRLCVVQWTAEVNAAITQKFFAWLVGPLEVKEVEVEFEGKAQTWKSGVQISKCRYLEQSGCKGMCINMCKVGSHSFVQSRQQMVASTAQQPTPWRPHPATHTPAQQPTPQHFPAEPLA